jgi:hypothetical protein
VGGTFSVGMLETFLPGFIFGLPLVLFGTIKTNRAISNLKTQTQITGTQQTQIGLAEEIRNFRPMQKAPRSITENTTNDLKSQLKIIDDTNYKK